MIHPKHRRRKCKQPQCKRWAMTSGLCCEHYLEALDRFEERSRNAKFRARGIRYRSTNPLIMKTP